MRYLTCEADRPPKGDRAPDNRGSNSLVPMSQARRLALARVNKAAASAGKGTRMARTPQPAFEALHPRLARKPAGPPVPAGSRVFGHAPREPNAALGRRAAQYVRMSTEHQQYSTANQRDAIARYADERGLEVVRTYADEGRSGLTLHGREGLSELLGDIVGGRADFAHLLVYDVSRWGRFQDIDESAYYEFLCRREGVKIEYCAEPFINDGSPMASVIKGMKRVMAGEYSRELSDKVWHAKVRLIRKGFRQGGSAGLGLRRMVLSATGEPRGIVERGQHKFLNTDRVVLVPGPKDEVRIVRWIFRQIADRGRMPTDIARELNSRGVRSDSGRPWTMNTVRGMVENEKYVGHLVFNRASARLRVRRTYNQPDKWIRADGAFAPVVPPALFRKAQEAIALWTTRISDEDALAALAALFQRHGTLSQHLINAQPSMPNSHFYEHRFGGLTSAYARVGYTPNRNYEYLRGFTSRQHVLAAFRAEVRSLLWLRGVDTATASRHVFLLGGQVRVAVMQACPVVDAARTTWPVQIHARPKPDWVLCACLRPRSMDVHSYHLVRGPLLSLEIGVPYRTARERHESSALDTLVNILVNALQRPATPDSAPSGPDVTPSHA